MNGYIDPETPGLVSNWRLNDDLGTTTAGDTILDSAGDNSGTVVGDPTFVDGAAPVYSYEFSTGEDIAVHGSLVATDAEAAGLTFTMAQGADHGTVSIDSDGDFIYTPADNYSGADSFKVKVSDGSATITRTISVSVAAENDAPQILGAQTTSGAVQFDGDDDYIQVDHHEDLNPGAGSFSVQLMADFRDTSSPQSLISKGNQTSSYEGWNVFIESGYLYARMGDGGSDPSAKAELRYDLTGIDGWHEVSFVLDRDAGTFEAYFDGNPDDWVETAGRDNDPSGWDISNYGPLLMGETIDGTLQAKTSIDEVRIWNKALSANDIANTTNSTLNGSEQNLVAYWQFEPDQLDQGTGIFTDLTSNGHDAELGTIVPGDGAEPQFLIPPVQAMSFDGDDKIVVLDNDQLSTGTNDFSVEAWVYRDTMGTENVIIDNRDSAYKGWMLGVSDNDTLELAMEDANGNTSNVFSTATIPSGQWVHVAVTADRGGDATFYVNGVAGGTASIQNTPGSLTAVSNLLIGDTDTSGSTYGGWNGMLSDVRIWDHVRDASDIGSDNFGHLQLPHPGLVGNWRLDEVSDTGTADDYSGHENHGAVTGATSVVTAQNIYGTELTLDEDTPLVGILQATDAEGDAVTWALDTGPVNGQLSLLSNGTFKYVPDDNYAGSDSFTATVTDANGASRSQIFSVTVGERVDAPQLLGVSAQETVLQFDGTDSLVAGRGDGDELAITGDVTVEMWINPSTLKNAHLLTFGSAQELVDHNVLYGLEMQSGGQLRFFHEDADLNNIVPTTGAGTISAGEWAHVAAVRDTNAGEVSFYVNGELIDTIAYSGEAAGGSESQLLFGALDLTSDYEGQMDEVRVWNGARTASEIADNYQRKFNDAEIAQASELVGYWDFDEKNADGAYADLTGNGANAAPASTTVNDVVGHLSRYTTFDGTDDNIVIANDATQSAADITIEAWFRADPTGTGFQRIISKETDGGAAGEYSLYLDGSGYLSGTGGGVNLNDTIDMRDGEWHHAALVVKSGIIGVGSTKLYLDGTEVDNSGLGILVPAPSSSQPVIIGDFDDDGDYPQNFKGDIADVRIWDDVRTAAEISENRAAEFSSSEPGLVGYYKLNDTSGATAADSSATSNDGTLQNGAEFSSDVLDRNAVAAHVAKHATFDGIVGSTGDNIAIPDNAAYETSTLSVEVWFRAEVDQETGASYHRLVTKPTSGNGNVFSLGFTEATGQLFGAAGSSFITPANGVGPDLRDGEWHHAAMTMQPGTNASSLYLDGVLIHTGTQGTVSGDSSPVMIGDYDDDGSHPQNFKGDIADVRIWSDIRTQSEIADNLLSDLDGTEPGLVGAWKLDDDANGTVADLSPTLNDGTLQNGASITEKTMLEVPTGNGLYFDGNDSGVQIPHSAYFQLTSEYTIGAWIRPDALSGVQRIIAQEAETTLDGFSFALNDDGLRLSYYGQEDLEIPASALADAGVSLKAGQWAHVAVSIDSDYDATFFVNGIDVGTIANTVTPTFNVGEALRIGSAVNSTPEVFEEFTGVISNVGLWSSTFNEAQVRDEINGMLDPSAGNVLGYWPLNDGAGTEISDQSGNGNTGTVSGASWIDTGPEIYADQTNMLEGGLLRGNLGVIDGDAGETFTFDVTDDAHFGELTVDAVTGAYSYRPVPNFTGEDSFTIRVTDSDGLSSEKTITFEVDNLRNNAPVADGYDGGAHISLADTETVVLPGVTTIQADFTIETWFRADGSQDDGDILFSTVGGTHDFGVKFNASGGLDGFVRSVDAAGPAVNVLDGEWHHVALRYTGSSGDFEIVVDGQAGSTEMKSFTNVGDLTFGDAAAGMGLVGDIDEVRYWNTLRSDEDIALNMHTTVDPGTPGLTTYLRADERAGTTVADLTGNGNHATVPSGSLVTDQESTLALSHTGRSSLSFSDANGSMADAGSITVPSDRLSLTFWANVTASATENRIMEINDLSGSSPNPLMVSVGDEGEVIVEIYDGTTNITLSSDAGWTYNEWSHFGVSYDGDVLELYIDGQLAGAEDASALDMSGVTGNMYMGMNIDAEAAGFNGELSNVQLWDRDVSEADVRAAMLGRVPAAGNNEVLGYWPFDDGLTGFAYDASGNGHTVSLSNVGVSVDVPPQPGNASGMEFDGASGFVKIAHDGAGDNPLALKGDMTVEFWVNPDSFGGGRVFSFSGEVATDGEPDNSLYELYITTGGNVQWVQEKEGGTDASPAVFTSTGITVDTWSHVALTRDAAAQTVTLYVNGSAVGSPLSYPDHPTGGENGELFLGVNGAMQHFFDGQIADFRVWNDVRAPSEISAGLSHELVGGEQGLVGYWPLSEGGGNIVHDLSPNAADGDIRGGTSWVDAGHLVTEVDTALEGRVFAHDMDGDALTFTVETDAVNGTVSMDADGTYAYTPDTSYSGPDSFTVKVVDGDGAVDYTTVTVSTLGEVTWLGGDVGGADDVSLVGNWTGGLPDAYTLATIGDTANPPMLTTLGGFPDDIMTVGALSNTGPDDFAVASGTILYLAQPVTSEISGGSLTLNGTVTGDGSMSFGASSTFNFVEGTISTAGPVVVNGTANITGSAVRTVDTDLILAGTTTFGSNAMINGTGKVDISGTVTASGTGSTISNNVYIAPNGTLQITATANNNMDLTGSSVINAGLILLGGSSTNTLDIDIANAVLQNDGTIQFTNTESSGVRNLRGNMINNGIIDVDANAQLIGSGGDDLLIDSRNGTIDIDAGTTLTIGSGSDVETLIVGPDTVLTGDGTLNMNTANELQIDGSFVYTADMPTIVLGSAVDIVSYDGTPVTFTVAEGATLDISNIEFDSQVTLINNGTLISTGAADILGPFVNMEGAEYNISAETTLTYLDFGDSVTNYGSIHINEPDSSTSFIQFNVFGSRQFVNHGSFSITQDGGSTTSTATINADIHNYGIMTFDRDVDVNAPGTPVHTNAGLLSLANGAVLAFKGTDDFTNLEGGVITGNGTLDFSATGTVFQNDGFIDVAGLTVETVDNLQVIGDMVATDSSEILLDIGNDGDEVGDSLTVTGQMTLNGTLEAYFISGYSPVVGDVFNVVSFATATAGSYFDAIRGLEGDGSTLLDIDIDTSFGLVSLTAVANAITATSGSDSYVGSSMADHVYGGDGDDILDGDGGEDVLLGGAGNDVIKISDNDFHFVDGGEGTDTLVAHNGLDMSQVRNDLISGFEVLDIGFGDLTLDGEDVVSITDGTNALTGSGNTLVVTRQDFGGAIDIGAGWGQTTSTTLTVDGELRTFDKQVHAATGATIYIEHVAENLTEMTDAEGFTLTGEDTYDYAGWALSSAGDINGDGFEDFIVGAYYADRNQTGATDDTGAAYVVFGAASGLSDIDLTSIASGDGTNGFKLEGGSALDFAGASVSKLGDVNGDGIDDIIIGAPGNSYSSEGAAYVVFGKTSGFNGAYDLDALGSDGFKITGAAVDDYTGEAVAGGGDINGDGLNDIIIGAPQDSGSPGKAFVIYGATTLGANITTAAATTIINGIDADDSAGLSVSIAGDLNGDGYDDVVIGGSGGDGLANGTANAGEAYVLFGKAGGLDANVNLSSLQAGDGSTGFTLTSNQAGSLLGLSVAMLGDINGDGFSDMAINAPNADSIYDNTGSAYVVFGKAGGYAATLNVDTLSGSDGFEIIGDGMDAYLGGMNTLSSAGDINGDGLDDIIVSAPSANYGSGAAYVVFGSRDGYAASMSLTDLTPDQGFVLEGANVDADSIGFAASAAGDINGDGFDDILIGSYDYYSGGAGVTYVVYGGDFTGDVDTTGSENDDVLIGTSGNDMLDGGESGADVLRGGAGDDVLIIGSENFARIDGGTGQDTLYLNGGFDLDLSAIANNMVTGIEHIDMNNEMANVLDIDFASVLDIGEAIDQLVGEANMLVVSMDETDTINWIGNWTEREEQPAAAASQGYTVFDSDDSNASVAVQNSMPGGGLA
ncbi:MAG: LamG-like jellyroll fold domain-containing protein [Rhodospirillales bacterium]